MPSAKYALSGSRLRLSNGRTATDFSGIAGGATVGDSEAVDVVTNLAADALRHGCQSQYPPIASALVIKPMRASSQTRRLFAAERLAVDSGVFSIAPPLTSKAQARTSATGKPSAITVMNVGKIHSGA